MNRRKIKILSVIGVFLFMMAAPPMPAASSSGYAYRVAQQKKAARLKAWRKRQLSSKVYKLDERAYINAIYYQYQLLYYPQPVPQAQPAPR